MIRETLSLLLSAVLPLLSAPAAPPSSVTQAAAPAALSAPAFDDFYAQRAIWDQNPVDETFLASIRDFSAQTTAGLLTGQENACYSPASLYFALSLSAAGAAGNTETQLLDLLGASNVDTLTQNCGNLYRVLYTDNEVGKMQIANALWMENGAEFAPPSCKPRLRTSMPRCIPPTWTRLRPLQPWSSGSPTTRAVKSNPPSNRLRTPSCI